MFRSVGKSSRSPLKNCGEKWGFCRTDWRVLVEIWEGRRGEPPWPLVSSPEHSSNRWRPWRSSPSSLFASPSPLHSSPLSATEYVFLPIKVPIFPSQNHPLLLQNCGSFGRFGRCVRPTTLVGVDGFGGRTVAVVGESQRRLDETPTWLLPPYAQGSY